MDQDNKNNLNSSLEFCTYIFINSCSIIQDPPRRIHRQRTAYKGEDFLHRESIMSNYKMSKTPRLADACSGWCGWRTRSTCWRCSSGRDGDGGEASTCVTRRQTPGAMEAAYWACSLATRRDWKESKVSSTPVRTGPIRRVLSGVSDDEQRSGETHARTNHKSS
jgi:hypothetical protein